MIKAGLVGLGVMGTSHFNNYKKLEEKGEPVKLTAVCDVDTAKLGGNKGVEGNIDVGDLNLDLSNYALYDDMEKMIAAEKLDYVDLCVPTFLHAPLSIRAMELGVNVFCEKPMAISSAACLEMAAAAERTGKALMVGHTLRYWNVYEAAKEFIDSGKFGKVVSGYFFRGGETPRWSWENWLLRKELSGGCLLDQHVHDVDAINWLFGMPEAVSTSGRNVFEGSGYDALSSNYIYGDGKVINAQDDWSMNGGGYGFSMSYRINFEGGVLDYQAGKLTVYPCGGEKYIPELPSESAYYKELRLFAEHLRGKTVLNLASLLHSHTDTIRIAEAEIESADKSGEKVWLK